MKAWIFSIVGIVILTVLLDLFMEDGETKKYIKGIVSLLTVIVIASPIPKLLNGNFGIGNGSGGSEIASDVRYLRSLNERRMEEYERATERRLEANGYPNLVVEGLLDVAATEYKILKVVVTKKTGILDEPPNINNIEAVVKIVSEGMRADREVVAVDV